MTPRNPMAMTFSGEPITGVVPARLTVHGGFLSGGQAAMVQAQYAQFCTSIRLSLLHSMTASYRLPDGSAMRVVSIRGVASVDVWVSAALEDEAIEGIGLRLQGWNNAPIAGVSQDYWLIKHKTQGDTWTARNHKMLVGARILWVNQDRSKWLACVLNGAVAQAFSKNKVAAEFAMPAGATLPAFISAHRDTQKAATSVLAINGGSVNLYQLDAISQLYVVKDSLVVAAAGLSLLGIDSSFALVVAGSAPSTAYTLALSPLLSVAGSQVIAEPAAVTPSVGSTLTFKSDKLFGPGTVKSVPFANNAHWASSPDLGIILYDAEGTTPPTFNNRVQARKDQLFAAGTAYMNREGFSYGGMGFWTNSQPAGSRTVFDAVGAMESASATYVESHKSTSAVNDTPWRGMSRNGALLQILRNVSATDSIDGTTTFNFASFTASKTATRQQVTTWTLPGGATITGTDTATDTFTENMTASFPNMTPVAAAITLDSVVTRTTLHLQHYDADIGCAVFLKEVVFGSGSMSWGKSSTQYSQSAPGSYVGQTTPVGEIFRFTSPETVLPSSGTASMSVCVYLAGVLAYEEALASAPATVSGVKYEPMVYSDMVFNPNAFSPKPGPGQWPATQDVYGPGTPTDGLIDTPTLYFGQPVGGDTFVKTTVGGSAGGLVVREQHLNLADAWAGSPAVFPSTAVVGGIFSMSVNVVKNARSGALALEVNYTHSGFAAPTNRARILLVSSTGVVRLNDLITPPVGTAKYDFKTNNFLVTV